MAGDKGALYYHSDYGTTPEPVNWGSTSVFSEAYLPILYDQSGQYVFDGWYFKEKKVKVGDTLDSLGYLGSDGFELYAKWTLKEGGGICE